MMPAGTPILVLKEGTRRERGKGAQFNNIAAAKAVADAVRSTLGPRGMDKMLVDSLGDVVITNDGVTILKEIDIEHPAAKMLVEVAKTQDEEAGDGTTTAVILAGELLKKAEDLIDQNIHPTVIAAGYRQAADKAHEVLERVAAKISIKEVDTLKKVGMTSMSSKSASGHKELLADIAVKAVTTVAEQRADGSYFVDDDNIQIVKKQGGSIADTQLVDGIIVDKERVHPGMPSEVKDAKIALVDAALEVKKTEIDAKIEITDPTQLQAFLNEEEAMLKRMVEIVRTSVVAVAIEDGKVISGGGSSAMEIALALRDFASTVGGREQIAIEAFADAVEVIPRTLAENAGLDPIDILIELRQQHKKGNKAAGINVFSGKVSDMRKENVI